MNLFVLIGSNLVARPLNTALNVLLLGLGISIVIVLLIVNTQVSEKLRTNARGIDLVAGAKGSPLQIILCNVFHIDYPTGNISLKEAERIARHPLVKKAVPLALGDSYNDFRIVGTDTAYVGLYDAQLASGSWWQKEGEVVIGSAAAAKSGFRPGSSFVSVHGLSAGGSAHEEHQYIVTGIMKRSGTVLDDIFLTSVESVWAAHGVHNAVGDTLPRSLPSRLVTSVEAGDSTKEITSLLIQFRSPVAALQLPRWINGNSRLQAAAPAFEMERLLSLMGAGIDVITGFAYVLIGISALSIFIALFNSLKERRYDLAVMRTLGASRVRLFFLVLAEGAALTVAGGSLGLLLGHTAVDIFVSYNEQGSRAGIVAWSFAQEEALILAGSLFLGILSSLIPSIQAYRTDISRTLAGE